MADKEIFDMHPLFEDVQMQRIFPDGKTFVDCTPKISPQEINNLYLAKKDQPGFDLKSFVLYHFEVPKSVAVNYQSNTKLSVEENIEQLWPVLSRQPDPKAGTLITLQSSYIVPGGRFGEIYYWDSYFTMLGLKESGKFEMIENMVKNFSYLIDTVGYIPNGNRTYFLGRSQPPFYSLMVRLLAEVKGKTVLKEYLPQLIKEYNFWMNGAGELNEKNHAQHRVVKMHDGEKMNRYWDEHDTPRPESYREDVELTNQSYQPPSALYRHLRAAAESGWDFSCRWFKDEKDFGSIHTTEIIPVDLNCLLYHLEETISSAYQLSNEKELEIKFNKLATDRRAAINKYCWNTEQGFYFDYDFVQQQQKKVWTLAGAVPLFFNLADRENVSVVAKNIEHSFLKAGGVVTSLYATEQQWDAPNGWAPLQWMTISGLEKYGFNELAKEIAKRWIKLNTDVFRRTGKLMEKYNVIDTHLEAGGGEYEGQDGFGWTNGVFLALKKKYNN